MAPIRRRMYKKKAAAKRKPAMKRKAGYRRRAPVRSKAFQTSAGGLTQDVWSYGRRQLPARIKAMKAVSAPDILTGNYAENLVVTAGVQNFRSYASLQPPQLKQILDLISNNSMNRAVVQTCQTELTFTNNTNAAVELEIMDVLFNRDIPSQGFEFTNSAFTYPVPIPTIENLIEVGCKAASGTNPAGSSVSEIVGASPFDSPLFKAYCRVAKRTHVILSSAGSHRHTQLVNLNKIAERAVQGTTDTFKYLRGWTYATLVKVKGVAGYAPESTPTTATVTPCFVQMYSSSRIKFSWVADNTQTVNYVNTLVDDIPNVRNIGSGAYEPISP